MSNPNPTTSAPAELATAPSDCCVSGIKHAGTPAGKTVTIAGIETYLSEPPSSSLNKSKSGDDASGGKGKGVILYFSDIYGPFYLNGQLLQDYFASRGYTVLGCDYFFGDPVHTHTEPGFDRNTWVGEKREKAREVVPGWVKGVRELYGKETKYCTVGYCFGGPFALDLATGNDVVAAAFAHPAFLNEDHFTKIKRPLLMSCAETDPTFPPESRRRAEDLLVAAKARYHIQVFAGVKHGFAVRGNPEVGDEWWAKEESARGVIAWFDRFTKVDKE
ncbi:Alpha/Beta hydrolase protein [Collybia nuda]|uniref:Alpha/Beta hydrolase protein n=1 Tax=Collybia nuda TaxID=64659 RepID=A0A9P6C9Z8_9AGAR|nr:Alpha/Beta hydrolase protein [Collybia nuda]